VSTAFLPAAPFITRNQTILVPSALSQRSQIDAKDAAQDQWKRIEHLYEKLARNYFSVPYLVRAYLAGLIVNTT
jgi:hypothetical protein